MVTTIGLTGAVRETSPARSGLRRMVSALVTVLSDTSRPALVVGPAFVMFRAVTFERRVPSNRFTLDSSLLRGELPVFCARTGTVGAGTASLFSLVDAIEGAGVLFL